MSPQSEDSPLVLSHPNLQPEYTQQERAWLLNVAHEGILSVLEGREIFPFEASQHLSQLRGVFTTLYWQRKLRGCVGYPAAVTPLYRAVIETARGAAFDDPRTFLEQTCRKAGLPVTAWLHGAKIEAFTAEVFADGDIVEIRMQK